MSIKLSSDTLQGWTVLIVDDEPDSLTVASMLLKYYGATVIEANNGVKGLELARSENPRFIISDLSMPGMDGWDMIVELKKDRRTAGIPVIALTAHAMAGDRTKAIAAGFHNYLSKPLVPETFVNDLLALLIDIPDIASDLDNN